MKWLHGELCYVQAWLWIVCGIVLKRAHLPMLAITCFDRGVHCATEATTLYGAKP